MIRRFRYLPDIETQSEHANSIDTRDWKLRALQTARVAGTITTIAGSALLTVGCIQKNQHTLSPEELKSANEATALRSLQDQQTDGRLVAAGLATLGLGVGAIGVAMEIEDRQRRSAPAQHRSTTT